MWFLKLRLKGGSNQENTANCKLYLQVDGISGQSLTYDSAFDQSRRFGSALAKEGLTKGDVLAIHLPNCPQYLTAVLGTIGISHRLRSSTVKPELTTTSE